MSEREHRPMEPEFDPFPLAVPDPPPALPDFFVHMGSMDDGDVCSDPQELADVYGAPVYVPTSWPGGTGQPRYVRSVSPIPGSTDTSYHAYASIPDHPAYVVVGGRYGEPPYVAGDPGWFAVPELKRFAGIAEVQEPTVNAFVQRGWQSIHLTGFPTLSSIIETALSLREVEPRRG